jgi:ATP diphosphatase
MTSKPASQPNQVQQARTLSDLLLIMQRLRDPESGCPWDIRQTFETIAPYTIEEAYEVADAIARQDWDHLKDELGDLLLQVVYHAQLACEQNYFEFDDVVAAICEKMIRRHPHVFGQSQARTLDAISHQWDAIKAQEQQDKNAKQQAAQIDSDKTTVLKDKPALPPLMRAIALQKQAAKYRFDWPGPEPVFDKISEELGEAREAFEAMADPSQKDHLEEEIGDMLFAITNLARHCNIDCDRALTRTNIKFINRFEAMFEVIRQQGKNPDDLTADEMEDIYRQIKTQM